MMHLSSCYERTKIIAQKSPAEFLQPGPCIVFNLTKFNIISRLLLLQSQHQLRCRHDLVRLR
jgi:hypothetical protein